MASYEVILTRTAQKQLRAIGTKEDRARVVRRIAALADDPRPHGSQMISGRPLYRVRQGRYRIVYSVEDQQLIVLVIRVAHRKGAFR